MPNKYLFCSLQNVQAAAAVYGVPTNQTAAGGSSGPGQHATAAASLPASAQHAAQLAAAAQQQASYKYFDLVQFTVSSNDYLQNFLKTARS